MAESEKTGQVSYQPQFQVIYEAERVDVSLSRWRLQMLCEQLMRGREKPTWDDALPWAGVLLAFLLALIPADFNDFLGVSADTWEAVVLFAAITAGFITLRKMYLAFKHRNEKSLTAKDIVDNLISEMQSSQESKS